MLCSKYTLLHCIPVIPPKNFLEHEMIRVREIEFALFLISGFVLDKKVPGKCFKILQVLYIHMLYMSPMSTYINGNIFFIEHKPKNWEEWIAIEDQSKETYFSAGMVQIF